MRLVQFIQRLCMSVPIGLDIVKVYPLAGPLQDMQDSW